MKNAHSGAHTHFASFAIDVQHDFVGVQHAHVQQPQLYQIAAVRSSQFQKLKLPQQQSIFLFDSFLDFFL